jgi:hypothetical protein
MLTQVTQPARFMVQQVAMAIHKPIYFNHSVPGCLQPGFLLADNIK